jgi:hypothetical protein
MRNMYAIICVACSFAGGYLHGEHQGVVKMRVMHAHERVSDFVRGESASVSEEDLSLVAPELKEAALRR